MRRRTYATDIDWGKVMEHVSSIFPNVEIDVKEKINVPLEGFIDLSVRLIDRPPRILLHASRSCEYASTLRDKGLQYLLTRTKFKEKEQVILDAIDEISIKYCLRSVKGCGIIYPEIGKVSFTDNFSLGTDFLLKPNYGEFSK